jgi:CubicO group peptidase (beta-lactamase class C family)
MAHDFEAERRQLLAAIAAAASMPAVAFGAPGANPAIRALVDHYVSTRNVANMVVAIGRLNKEPEFVSAGTSELGAGANAGPDSLYRIYSMTKPIAGAAVMMLIEQGKLTLDTQVASILPAFAKMNVLVDPANSLETKPAQNPITIRHLVTHTSGLAYAASAPPPLAKLYLEKAVDPGRTSPQLAGKRPLGLDAFCAAAASLPLLFEPGTKWNYSIGLDIVGLVVEKIAGMPFEDFLAQQIFMPLGMGDTFFAVPAGRLDRLTANYEFTADGPKLIEAAKDSMFAKIPEIPSGGGGLVSSARDYAKFMNMLLSEGQISGSKAGSTRVMKTETARVMMSNILPSGVIASSPNLPPSGYGAGGRWTLEAVPGGEGAGTFGWSGAANSHAFVDRANGVYVVLMTQLMKWMPSPLLSDLDKALYADLARK